MGTVTRRWWKAATAAVVVSGGGYAAFGPNPAATAQVPRTPAPPAAKAAAPAPLNPALTRSSSPLAPAAASATPVPPTPGAVIPASAVLPAAQPPVPPLPALPGGPPLPPPPVGVVPMADVKAPPLPALPGIPAPIPMPPVAPPLQPLKSAPMVRPVEPVKSVSPLQPADRGNSFKTDAAWKAPAVAPPPREVFEPVAATPAEPPVRVADRPKPPQAPVGPSERDVFPLPGATPPAVPVAVQPVTPMPPALPVAPAVPTPPTTNVATTPGVNPMMFRSTAAAAVIGGALVMPQTKADAPAGGTAETQATKDAPKTADEKLTDIQRDLHRLTELLDGKRDETGTRLPSDPGLVQQVRDLKDKVAAMERQMAELKTTSLRPPGAGSAIPGIPNPMPAPAADPAAAKGTVRVVNEYPVEITMVVNNRSYRVSPNATQDIPVVPGDFSYQLLSGSTALAPTRSSIRDREVVTLRIK